MTIDVRSSPIFDMCIYLINTAETDHDEELSAFMKILDNSARSCGLY